MEDKLEGVEQICEYLHWSKGKFQSRLKKLQEAGVVFQDRIGSPPILMWCSFRSLIQRYCALCAQNKEIL